MKTIAVIAEFNPFHNGHKYFLDTARSLSGADRVMVIMSGDFVQRGEPAVFDKFERTRHALRGGADLVLELPLKYAAGSAEVFARGAVYLLDSLGCVDELWFGSECGDINKLLEVSSLLHDESEQFSECLNDGLCTGLTHPAARSAAVEKCFGREAAKIISEPNNILALEYCAALKYFSSAIVPKTVKREGAGYNDTGADSTYCSAAAVREMMKANVGKTAGFVPSYVHDTIASGMYMENNDFSLILRSKLVGMTASDLSGYRDINVPLANRLFRFKNDFRLITQYIELVKSRNLTYAHISRAVISILLDLKDGPLYSDTFVRMLGHNGCSDLMSLISEKSRIIFTARPEDPDSYKEDLYASELYDTVRSSKYSIPFTKEFSKHTPVVIRQLSHQSPD